MNGKIAEDLKIWLFFKEFGFFTFVDARCA
jgi:hypothetical protein